MVPYFEKLKKDGAEYLPITDYEMTRFFIQPDEAVTRILEAVKLMRGGEIFCPKMTSLKIVDVAKMIAPNMPTKEVGMRKGERLHEKMLTSAEIAMTYARKNFYIVNGSGKKVSKNFVYSSENHLEGKI